MTEILTNVFCWLLILIMVVIGICGCIIIVLATIEGIKAIKDNDKK